MNPKGKSQRDLLAAVILIVAAMATVILPGSRTPLTQAWIYLAGAGIITAAATLWHTVKREPHPPAQNADAGPVPGSEA